MTLRSATVEDTTAISDIAERSFQASYSLSPDQIAVLLDEEFSQTALKARIEDETTVLLLAEDGGTVRGFVDADRETGTIRWLHVDPLERGNGVGTALVERVMDDLAGGEPLTAQVLETATEGDTFLERFGLHRSDSKAAEFGDQRLGVQTYTKAATDEDPNEPAVEVPENVVVDGEERSVGRDERIPGTEAPFFPTYTDQRHSERHGFFCSSCASTAVTADGLDRLECDGCGNKHRADEWDDAYL